jgi:hypothetical protein
MHYQVICSSACHHVGTLMAYNYPKGNGPLFLPRIAVWQRMQTARSRASSIVARTKGDARFFLACSWFYVVQCKKIMLSVNNRMPLVASLLITCRDVSKRTIKSQFYSDMILQILFLKGLTCKLVNESIFWNGGWRKKTISTIFFQPLYFSLIPGSTKYRARLCLLELRRWLASIRHLAYLE